MNKSLLFMALSGILLQVHGAAALSGGVSGSGTLASAIPLPKGIMQIDMGGNFFSGENMGLVQPSDRRPLGSINGAQRIDFMSAISYGFTSYFESSLLVPYYKDTDNLGKDHAGLGDIRASFKYNYPPYPHKEGFKLSFLLQLDIPTASESEGGWTRNSWYLESGPDRNPSRTKNAHGADGVVGITQLLSTANFGAIDGMWPLLVHLNFGAAFSGASSQNAFLLGGGIEATPHPVVTAFFSFQSQITVSGASKNIPLFDYPYQSSFGLQFNIPRSGVAIYGGSHFAINSMPGVLWSPPRDADPATAYNNRAPDFGVFGGLSVNINTKSKKSK